MVWAFVFVFCLLSALLIEQLEIDRKQDERERGSDMRQRAPIRDMNWGHRSEDKASAHETPAVPIELNNAVMIVVIS